jgi:hypothetical protein
LLKVGLKLGSSDGTRLGLSLRGRADVGKRVGAFTEDGGFHLTKSGSACVSLEVFSTVGRILRWPKRMKLGTTLGTWLGKSEGESNGRVEGFEVLTGMATRVVGDDGDEPFVGRAVGELIDDILEGLAVG